MVSETRGGDLTHNGMCKAVNVLTELGQRLTAQHFPSSSTVAAESDSPPAVDDGDFDPMAALDGDAESSPVKPSKGKYAHKKVRHQILYVDMHKNVFLRQPMMTKMVLQHHSSSSKDWMSLKYLSALIY